MLVQSGFQAIADFMESPIFINLLSHNFDSGFEACKRLGTEKDPRVVRLYYSGSMASFHVNLLPSAGKTQLLNIGV